MTIAQVTLPTWRTPLSGTNAMTLGTTITISDGTNGDTATITNIQGNVVTLSRPLGHAYAQTVLSATGATGGVLSYPSRPC